MKPILWVLIILMAQQAICAPSKLDDSDKQIENDDEHQRLKRASRNGQTQSQYLNFGDSQTEGKADAEITRYGSRASVSGSNGMGQAQSQSSGGGCDECYGSGGSAHGPDPLTSSSGAGIPQSHASSRYPSGFDAHGRPYTLPSSGYSSQGFGPSVRGPSNLRDLQTFGTVVPSTGDNISQNGVLSVTPPSITAHLNKLENIYQRNRNQPSSNDDRSSFLKSPISNGKTHTTSNGADHTTIPSILARRKMIPNNLDNNKLVDGGGPSAPPSFETQPTSRPSLSNYGSNGSDFPDNLLPSQRIQPNRESYSKTRTEDQQSPHDRSLGTAGNDFYRSRTSNAPVDRSITPTGSILHTGNLPSLSQPPSQSSISTPSVQPDSSVYTGSSPNQSPASYGTDSAMSQPGTDSLSNLRNAFKLPQGLCLVRCDTLKPGQYTLTPEQIRDAIIASGLIDQRGGPNQDTALSKFPTISQPAQDLYSFKQPSGLGSYQPQDLLLNQQLGHVASQLPQNVPSFQQPSGPGLYPPQDLPLNQQPGRVGSQLPQNLPSFQQPSGPGSYPTQGLPTYQQPSGTGSYSTQQFSSGPGSYPTQGLLTYQQPSGPGSYPTQGLPSFQQPAYPTQGLPLNQQLGGVGSQSTQDLPSFQQPSGPGSYQPKDLPRNQQLGRVASQLPQNVPSFQQPSGPGLYPPQDLPLNQQPGRVGSQLPQNLPSFQQPSGPGSYPTQGLPTYQQPSGPGSYSTQQFSSGPGSYPAQGLPKYQQPSGQGSYPTQGLPTYQQPSGSGLYPTLGLPTFQQPSGPGPYPTQGLPLNQQIEGVGSQPSQDLSSFQHQLPTPTHFPPTGQFGAGPHANSVQPVFSGSTTQGSGHVASPGYPIPLTPVSYPPPSAANLVYGGGDGSTLSGSSQGVGLENESTSGLDEDGESQAESSITNGRVLANAQGTKNGGTAQTQVEGTYSGSGSFSASAQTEDKNRKAQAQVMGNKDGALSSSQGTGGKSQAQSQVEVNEKTGGTSASGQTSGAQHSSQSEVTVNEKGGLSDAQSSGPGQTSSQAQIGFRPEGTNPKGNIFNGGGQASAQSSVYSGQSQSQIQGSSKYGISYHGAAQAASGTKEQVSSYRENSKTLFQSIGQFSRSNRDSITQAPPSDIANINDIGLRPLPKTSSSIPDPTPDDSLDEEDYKELNDEGEDEYNDSPDSLKDIKSKASRVKIELPKRIESSSTEISKEIETTTPQTAKVENKIADSAKLIRMPAVRSETVPNGFKGKIEEKHQRSSKNQIDFDKKINVKPDTYVTVTKSVSGSLDNSKAATDDDKKFESTYYTKTSTCGYFTFSCNIVYGSNGRSKVCRPKVPENGKC